ncbi:hypothetical protein RhiirC2_772648 [Rhizophagus irregularis]|uniref:Protein kinase domain-containing protein n=1 Tax=Rhizophagus irregularis TaxID=588596 RepID=A0A2N1NR06_9GLOM|nr:hypothetical protein RhiirC2_772648 [Rhizophagus irregularis]
MIWNWQFDGPIEKNSPILKRLTIGKPNESMNNFLKEAKALFHCYNQENSCFRIKGFTQDPLSMQYYIITRYAENGGLRQYLRENTSLSWEDQLYILWDISLDFERIHKTGLIHRDIHADNILHTGKVAHLDYGTKVHDGVAYIPDFGFSIAAHSDNNTEELGNLWCHSLHRPRSA